MTLHISEDFGACLVNWSIVSFAVSASICLGISGRDIGQRRVPEPPDRITGTILRAVMNPPGGAEL